MATLGITIPFYRNVAYLRTAIQSVTEQSSEDWKLWVLDDSGSNELEAAVRETVEAFDDPRIRYHRNDETQGMVANWNRCIDLADTDFVSLLHGDDRLLSDYAALMQGMADAHPKAVALYCGAEIIDASGERTFSVADSIKAWIAPAASGDTTLHGEAGATTLHGKAGATALMRGNFIMCPTLCFRRNALGARRFDASWEQVQDLELTVRLLMEGETIVGSPEIAYAYRRHPESATTVQSGNRLRFEEEFRLFDQIADRADALGWTETARIARRKRIVKLHLLYRALQDLLHLRPGGAFETLRYLGSRWR
jgi:glycosyltransferase involved in cell wall biosynthesis